jgi:hypothetical protein
LVIFNIGIEVSTVHGIRIILVRNWAILACTRVPRRYHTFVHNASVVRSGAIIMHVVSSETLATDLPQRAVIFVMIGRVLIALEAVWEGSRRPRLLTFLARKEANASL